MTCCTPVPIYQLQYVSYIECIGRGLFEEESSKCRQCCLPLGSLGKLPLAMVVNPMLDGCKSKRCISFLAFLVLLSTVFITNFDIIPFTSFFNVKVGDLVQVRSPACHPNRRLHLPHNKCCEGTGCCPNGLAKVVQGQKVTWTNETELVIVAPQATSLKYARGDSRSLNLSWIRDQSIFPYVLCPACTVEIDPVCFVKSNQGYESSGWLSFIVNNYDRLPRTVAFVHGHRWLQFGPTNGNCTNLDRIVQLRPFLNEDIFIYLSLWCIFQLIFYFPPWDSSP